MRVVAISLLVAAPALVSAAVTPVRRQNSGTATFYYTGTGNAYVIHTFAMNFDQPVHYSSGSCGSYLSDTAYVR